MGEGIASIKRSGSSSGPVSPSWFWHRQLKKPFFGRFMKTWRWPNGIAADGWSRAEVKSRSHSHLVVLTGLTHVAEPRGVVVCVHPMGLAAKGFWLRYGHAAQLREAGFHVVSFDFNGFGESPSTNFDYPGDVLSVGKWARECFPDLPVHALTASFGAINTLCAISDADFPFRKVVAEGCAASLPDFWQAYPVAHAVLAVCRKLNPAAELRLRPMHHLARMRDGVDVLLIHSKVDRWTPVEFGARLANAASRPERIRRLVLERADHTHGFRDEPEVYWPAVKAFFDEPVEGESASR